MERIWQWAWNRYGRNYSWVVMVFLLVAMLPPYLLWSLMIVSLDRSHRFPEAAAMAVGVVAVMAYLVVSPGHEISQRIEQYAAGRDVNRAAALSDTYIWGRRMCTRGLISGAVGIAVLFVAVGALSGATGSRLLQFGVMGAALGIAVQTMGIHNLPEAALRPARMAVAGDTGLGDGLPRSRPSFVTWSNLSMLATSFVFASGGALLATTLHLGSATPWLSVATGAVFTASFVPITIGAIFSPSMLPIRDLADGTLRVAAGDYSRPVPVVQDDDLGALAASFNRMQTGLAERQRLQGAFGTYVDPVLAARLLEQGDDVFTGERREVTVVFIDIRDFTSYAEFHSAEDTVARLNALFEIVVPAVVDAGGHVNKFLGDGALAVFGAPNEIEDHCDAALRASLLINCLVRERFADDLSIGLGINTGVVIAGTIGGGGKLEFTLIGDTVNVAARVEQLTKITGDAILLTQQSVDALKSRPSALIDRGSHALKGKSPPVRVFAVGQG
jgi:class 3 adenylate cyclase